MVTSHGPGNKRLVSIYHHHTHVFDVDVYVAALVGQRRLEGVVFIFWNLSTMRVIL